VGLRVVPRAGTRDQQTAFPAQALVWSFKSRSPRAPKSFSADKDQIALGEALAARVVEATRLTAEAVAAAGLCELGSSRFAKSIHDVHNLATRVIARFLITGQGTTETERNFIDKFGVLGALQGLPVSTLARSYQLWRDTNLRILNEEVKRLGTPQAVFEEAGKIIRSRADSAIVGLALAYEAVLTGPPIAQTTRTMVVA
jgi:hypothetical protein